MNPAFVFCGCVLAVFPIACASRDSPPCEYPPASQVSRSDCLRIAEAYRTHRWRPTSQNIFHGFDHRGIRVDTPDIGYQPRGGERPGWWIPNASNTGVPYQWGGFDTPASFDAALRIGKRAGDVYSESKRRLLDDAVSTECCGIDCSGFISRCWRLDCSHSTRELAALCEPLPSFDDLLPGDVLDKPNEHVLLFVRFLDPAHERFEAYEAGSPPLWKVLKHPIPTWYVRGLDYKPFRYRNIIEH
jgi:hypothetical protein